MSIFFNATKLSKKEKDFIGYYDTCQPSSLGVSLVDMGNDTFQDGDVVLLNCGAFNPVHEGHYSMFTRAEKLLKSQGNTNRVLKYFVPSNDSYNSIKKGLQYIPFNERIDKLSKFKEDTFVDPWVAYCHNEDINVIDIALRWEKIIASEYGVKLRIIVLVGGDNANMTQVLKYMPDTKIEFIVIERVGYEINQILLDPRVHLINVTEKYESSTEILAKQALSFTNKSSGNNIEKYYIRVNPEVSYENKILGLILQHTNPFSTIEINTIKSDIEKYKNLIYTYLSDYGNDVNFIFLDTQVEDYLDELLKISPNIGLFFTSRLYINGGVKKIGRHDWKKDYTNLKNAKHTIIFDDDQFSSGETYLGLDKTLNYAKHIIKQDLEKMGYNNDNIYAHTLRTYHKGEEIIDVRDFCLGSDYGGLYMLVNNQHLRVPYFYPYLCPTTRANLNNPLLLSEKIFKTINHKVIMLMSLRNGKTKNKIPRLTKNTKTIKQIAEINNR